ncbi:rhodanese-like domain-containing protein [Faecalibacter macacae]|uniref:Rhodanese-like domain-containing protein n=1 Tax=Faecalibacter macacae TaxID=1859289 RepID=A0A3L9MCL5_9FLAO|nr:rhodanese-like domain-containing protein [Faecalibacter macacae]RLZ09706.1 rhodanese-like domain-containing protein [Faecalibacter macacae]
MIQNIILIDVRTPEEFQNGHFPNSINIPLHELENRLNEIDRSKIIVTLCRSGARSEQAKSILIKHGYNSSNGGAWSVFNENK